MIIECTVTPDDFLETTIVHREVPYVSIENCGARQVWLNEESLVKLIDHLQNTALPSLREGALEHLILPKEYNQHNPL